MKKKILALALAALLVLSFAAFTGCGQKDEPASKPADFKLVLGLDATFEPYGFTNDKGEIVGFDIDLAKEVCTRNGWEFEAKPIDWNSKDTELNSGTINCIWNGFTINGRENDYTWSKPYVNASQVIVIKGDSDAKALKDLAGKTVVTQAGSSAESAILDEENEDMVALKASLKELKTVPDYAGAFLELQSGASDAIAMDEGVAVSMMANFDEGTFAILEEKLTNEQYGVGFKLGDEALRDSVQKTLDEMLADGTTEKLAETWGVQDALVK